MKIALFTTTAFISALGVSLVQAEEPREWLFVSTGVSAVSAQNVLTIQDSDGKAFGFTDRPYREHANLTSEQLAKLWEAGASFSADPPNAVLTYIADGKPNEAEIILKTATGSGDTMSFEFEILSGTVQPNIGSYSLFIDGIFIPFDSSF